jgi:sugar diacid utilization regulator
MIFLTIFFADNVRFKINNKKMIIHQNFLLNYRLTNENKHKIIL